MVGRLFGFASQHFSTNLHIFTVRPSCSAARGLAGLFPLTIWVTTDPPSVLLKGTSPEKTSTTSMANANTSAGLDDITKLELALSGGSMISGASLRKESVGTAIMKLGFEVMGLRP